MALVGLHNLWLYGGIHSYSDCGGGCGAEFDGGDTIGGAGGTTKGGAGAT